MNTPLALQHALAVQRIEGWFPNLDDEGLLESLALDKITITYAIDQQLSIYRTEKTTTYKRPLFSFYDPYLLSGKNIMKNKFSITSPTALHQLESFISAARIIELCKSVQSNNISIDICDIHAIHAHIFGDIYPWAGTHRTVNIKKEETLFALTKKITPLLKHANESLAQFYNASSIDERVLYLAATYSIYNYVHPFREGNGRAGMTWLELNCIKTGWHLDFTAIDSNHWYYASNAAKPLYRNGSTNPKPIYELLRPCFMELPA